LVDAQPSNLAGIEGSMRSSVPRVPTIIDSPMPTIATRAPVRTPLRLGRLGDHRLAELAAAGDERAFEVVYDRHHRALLGFCRHMVGSREEAEDALQQTFLRAHRALAEHGPPDDLRPWLFTIARNRCRSLLAARRAETEVDEDLASVDGLGEQVQARADLRAVVADVERLPDDQRAALVMAELADLSHAQIGEVIGVRTDKVKALIHQARTTLIAERDARERPCEDVREQLATARGGALRRGPLRRHLRQCPSCSAYRDAVAEQRRTLALVLPVIPSAGLKAGILGAASTAGGAAAGGAVVGGASLGGGLAAKVVASALLLGAAGGGGAAIVDSPDRAPRKAVVEPAPAAAAPVSTGATPTPTPAAPAPAAGAPGRAERRDAATRGRAKARARAKARRNVSRGAERAPGQSKRLLARARARGQEGKTPGSSRSPRAGARPPKAAKPATPPGATAPGRTQPLGRSKAKRAPRAEPTPVPLPAVLEEKAPKAKRR
jgi:RNA polymerase sigma factor (sigma-70 family)